MRSRLFKLLAVFGSLAIVGFTASQAGLTLSGGSVAGNDPDRPAVLGGIDEGTYLQMRDHQIALYRGFPFKAKGNPRSSAVGMMNRQVARMERNAPSAAALSKTKWKALGPAPVPNGQTFGTSVPVSGRVTAIAIDPTDANIVYVGTAQGGVYRTLNGLSATPTWKPLMDKAKSLAIGALALDPADRTELFVGTGEGNGSLDSYAGVGIYRITGANGTTPTVQGPFETRTGNPNTTHAFLNTSITSIAIDPNNDNRMYVGNTIGIGGASGTQPPSFGTGGAFVGLYLTTNAQDTSPTFIRVPDLPGSGTGAVTDTVFQPGSSSVLLAGLDCLNTSGCSSGVYRSDNADTTHTFAQKVTTSPVSIKFAIDKVSTTTTALATLDLNNGTLVKSTDLFQSAPTTLAGVTGFCDGQCGYDAPVAIDPGNASNMYVGGNAEPQTVGVTHIFQYSTNGGSNWSVSSTKLHADEHAIAVAPSNTSDIYTGNDGGIFRSTNSGVSWTSLNTASFNAIQFESVATHRTDRNFFIGGTQDNGTLWHKPTTGAWKRIDFGDGGFSAIDQVSKSTTKITMYHTYFNRTGVAIALARVNNTASAHDGNWTVLGCGFTSATPNGIDCSDQTLFYAPLELGPKPTHTSKSDSLYFGTDHLYRSTNKGTTMKKASQDFSPTGFHVISAIGIAPQSDKFRMVGLDDGRVFATTTGSSSLKNVSSGSFPHNAGAAGGKQYIGSVTFDPKNKNTAYATFDGYSGGLATSAHPTRAHVWRVTNLSNAGTRKWAPVGKGLPDVPVNAFAIDPRDHTALYAGTDIGVYRSLNSGKSWAPYGTGIPRVAVFGLDFLKRGTVGEALVAATHGRGAFEILTGQ